MARETRGSRTRQDVQANQPEVFQPVQHPRLVGRPPAGPGWEHEIKFDGYRMQMHVRAGKPTIYTRNGHDWTARFPEIAADLATLPDCILDGELCAIDSNGQPDFSRLRASISPGRTADLVVFVFDVLWGNGEDLRPYALEARRAVLGELLRAVESWRLRGVESFRQPGPALLASACRMGLEGLVSKRLDGRYSAGRGDGWVKAKCRPSQEVVIGLTSRFVR